jgi:hypothetical protein
MRRHDYDSLTPAILLSDDVPNTGLSILDLLLRFRVSKLVLSLSNWISEAALQNNSNHAHIEWFVSVGKRAAL